MECSAWSPQKALSALLDCRLATAAADLSFPARAGPVETAAASPLPRLRSAARLLLGTAAPAASLPSARPRAGARVRPTLRARRGAPAGGASGGGGGGAPPGRGGAGGGGGGPPRAGGGG